MTTRLDIINAMLGVNGEAPVSSASSIDPAAIQANNALKRIDRAVQARGWWFNREPNLLLSPSVSGEIILPSNTLAVDPVASKSSLVQRGSKLYDRATSSYTIGEAVRVDIVLQLAIEELPILAADYIMAKGMKEYYEDDDGDEQKANRLEKRMNEAYGFLFREHLNNLNLNQKDSPTGIALRLATDVSGYSAPENLFVEE